MRFGNLKIIALFAAVTGASGLAADKTASNAEAAPPILWRDPADISSRNLFYGPGGEKDQPNPQKTYTFIEEDLNGTNPKIVVRDEDGVKWTVKLGPEARPETAATRLTWAVGYFANEDYFLSSLKVVDMPGHLRRGQKLLAPDGSLSNVRLKRHSADEKKSESWPWRENDFTGTRELNGLRVMMALLNNWDLTDENNGIYTVKNEQGVKERIYMVSDLGSTFGSGNLTWPMRNARGNLRTYRSSKFITRIGPDYVDFHAPARTSLFFLATPHEYFSKFKLRWIGKHVPRNDAKWLGKLLARLSPDQIRDAFRAAGYSPQEVEGFSTVFEHRIAELEDL